MTPGTAGDPPRRNRRIRTMPTAPPEEVPIGQRKDEPSLRMRQQLIDELIRYRELMHLSHAEVGQRMGITASSVAQFEKQTNWYLVTLLAYARAVGCDLNLSVRMSSLPDGANPSAAMSGRPA